MATRESSSITTHTTLLTRLADESDHAAWSEFRDRYAALILGYARRCGLQNADCDDILQEVCQDLLRAMPHFTYDPARGRFRDYLCKLTRSVIWQVVQARKPETPAREGLDSVAPEPADDASDGRWEEEWRDYHVRRAMELIRPNFNDAVWSAFQRYALKGDPADLVAADLGLSVSQVYKAKSDVKTSLVAQVACQVDDEG